MLKKILRRFVSSNDLEHHEIHQVPSDIASVDTADKLGESEVNKSFFVPPGHFYSPLPDIEFIKENESKIFTKPIGAFAGIDLRDTQQLQLLNIFKEYYKDLDFPEQKKSDYRYFFENPAYSYSDAIFLHCMIRYTKPRKIVEIGSGFSSCMTLDTNELFFKSSIETTFIEPYPELLLNLIREDDASNIRLIPKNLQDVNLSIFKELQENDILFIDSTHVSKVYSDVNQIFFDILPALNKGVFIHFHDIFYPFEYPRAWINENRAWNELYMLRAFLLYNSSFRVVAFNTYLEDKYKVFFANHMPLCLKNLGGSIWLQKY